MRFPPTIEPSDEQLRAAWRALATPDWGTYEAACRAAQHFALARGRARMQAMGGHLDEAPHAGLPEPQRHPPPAGNNTAPPVPRTPPQFDRMRAASGEREDD